MWGRAARYVSYKRRKKILVDNFRVFIKRLALRQRSLTGSSFRYPPALLRNTVSCARWVIGAGNSVAETCVCVWVGGCVTPKTLRVTAVVQFYPFARTYQKGAPLLTRPSESVLSAVRCSHVAQSRASQVSERTRGPSSSGGVLY